MYAPAYPSTHLLFPLQFLEFLVPVGLEEECVWKNPWNKQQHDYWSLSMAVDSATLRPDRPAVTHPLKATGRIWRSPLMVVQYLKCLMFVAFMESVSLNSPMPMPLQTVKRDVCSITRVELRRLTLHKQEARTSCHALLIHPDDPEGTLQVPGLLWQASVFPPVPGVGLGLSSSQTSVRFEFSHWTESRHSQRHWLLPFPSTTVHRPGLQVAPLCLVRESPPPSPPPWKLAL